MPIVFTLKKSPLTLYWVYVWTVKTVFLFYFYINVFLMFQFQCIINISKLSQHYNKIKMLIAVLSGTIYRPKKLVSVTGLCARVCMYVKCGGTDFMWLFSANCVAKQVRKTIPAVSIHPFHHPSVYPVLCFSFDAFLKVEMIKAFFFLINIRLNIASSSL